jgi:hypothetical protein
VTLKGADRCILHSVPPALTGTMACGLNSVAGNVVASSQANSAYGGRKCPFVRLRVTRDLGRSAFVLTLLAVFLAVAVAANLPHRHDGAAGRTCQLCQLHRSPPGLPPAQLVVGPCLLVTWESIELPVISCSEVPLPSNSPRAPPA